MSNLYSSITNQPAVVALLRLLYRDKIGSAWFGAIALLVALFEGASFAMNTIYPPCPSGERIEMPRPFSKHGGVSYYTNLPNLGRISDDIRHPDRSTIVVCEGSRMIGPAHALHDEISKHGRGRFSHWGNAIIFTTSDNSDPNTNGRGYLAIRPDGQ
jgi:hypothetical protein